MLVVACRVLFSFRMLIRAEEDVPDLPSPLSYRRTLWMAGPPLRVLTDLSVIYTPTGFGGKGLWSYQHEVRVGCGSPYQVLKTSRHGVTDLSTCLSQAAPLSREVFPPVKHDPPWIGVCCPMLYGPCQQGELGFVVSVTAPPGTVGCY